MKNLITITDCMSFLLFAGCGAEKPRPYDGNKNAANFADILEQNPNGVLATRNGGRLRTQIMSLQFVEGNKVYFCTGSEKPLYEQLRRFPEVSYCTWPQDFEPVVSLNGKVVFRATLINFDWKAGQSPASIINFFANEELMRSDSSS